MSISNSCKVKLRPISENQRSCLECYYGSQLLGGSPAWCLHTGNKIHELVGCELWRKEELEELQRENEQIKEYNTDLKQSLDWANEKETEWSNRIEELKTDLEYAKAIIKDLLNNSHEYAKQNAEDFLKGEKK